MCILNYYLCTMKWLNGVLKTFPHIKLQTLLAYLITTFAILVVAILLERFVSWLITRRVKKLRTKGNLSSNLLFYGYLFAGIIYTTAFILIVYTIPALKSIALSLFAGAGILAAIIGFASQQAISNIISGIFIVISKPFRVGDRVDIGIEYEGVVEEITLRHTVIRNFENRSIIIPNSLINSQTIVNSSLYNQMICRHVEFNISYETSIDRAIAIIREEAEKHPDTFDHRTPEEMSVDWPVVPVRVVELGEYYVKLRAYVWAKDSATSFVIYTDLRKIVKERFDKEGFEWPMPKRKIIQ